jgi:hypothetical protein
MASAYLTRTFTAGNRKTYTFSAWVKRAKLSGTYQGIITAQTADQGLFFGGGDELELFIGDATQLKTSAKYRDTNGWYHIVFAVDTTQATSSNRTKLWVNGEQVTSFSPSSYPTQNNDTLFNNSGGTMRLGNHGTQSYNFDGSMAHVHFIDGTAYDADTFGETDSTTGIWKPKTAPSVTYGTNGFFLKMENSASMGTDSSGNSNNLTVSGTITQTIDTPSNVFATGNPLSSNATMTNGNLSFSGTYNWKSTLAFSSGKYYAECKVTNSNTYNPMLGIGQVGSSNIDNPGGTGYAGNTANSYAYQRDGKIFANGSSTATQTGLTTISQNDIVGIAVDLDSATKTIKWYINGTLAATENLTETASEPYVFWTYASGSQPGTGDWNFGNGYFGTTAVASAGTNSGIGTFEYDVPSGYKALCTKNINAQEYS